MASPIPPPDPSSQGRRSTARTILLYALSVGLPALVSVFSIPVIVKVAGAEGWASIAVGQAAGNISAVLIGLGWGYSGVTVVTSSTTVERGSLIRDSAVARLVVAPFVIGIMCAGLIVLPSADTELSLLAAIGMALVGLGSPWFFAGIGKPEQLLVFDTLPRLFVPLLGLVAALFYHDPRPYLYAIILSALVSALLSLLRATRTYSAPWRFAGALRNSLAQVWAGITVIVASTYLSLPTLILGAVAPSAVPSYALVERIGRYASLAMTPFYQWQQGWVASGGDRIPRRARQAALNGVTIGLGVGLVTAAVTPFLGSVLTGSEISVTPPLVIVMGLVVSVSLISRSTGSSSLLALGRNRLIAISTVAGAAAGVPLIGVLGATWGADGAALGLLTSEIVVIAIQAIGLRSALRLEAG